MSISKERLKEIEEFKNTDFSDCPVLTDEQLSLLRPCHLVNRKLWKPQKYTVSIRIDSRSVEKLRKKGKGWQTSVNESLRFAIQHGML